MNIETKKPKFRRKHYFISKRFQMRYVGVILIFMFLTALLCSYVVYYTSMMVLGEKLASVYPQGRLMPIVNMVNLRILLSLTFLTPLVVVVGIFLSHKIAGPLFRIERFLGGMAQKDFSSRLILRKGDELTSLANRVNEVVDSVRSCVIDQKSRVNQVMNELADLKKASAPSAGAPLSLSDHINKLDEEVKGIGKILDSYLLQKTSS